MAERRPITARDVKIERRGLLGDVRRGLRTPLLLRPRRAGRARRAAPFPARRVHRRGALHAALRAVLPPRARSSRTTSWPRSRRRSTSSTGSSPTRSRCGSRSRTSRSAGPGQLEAPTPRTPCACSVRDPDYSVEMSGRLTKLENAISKQRTIKFRYWSITRDEEAERTVNPYALLPERGSWYLIGLDLDKEELRTFRVSRIRGDIRFATRRERDFRAPEDFDASGLPRPPAVAVRRDQGRGARSSSTRTRPGGSSAPFGERGRSRSDVFRTHVRRPRAARLVGPQARTAAPARSRRPSSWTRSRAIARGVAAAHEGQAAARLPRPPSPAKRGAADRAARRPGRAGALRRPPGAARPPARALRRRGSRRHPRRRADRAVQPHGRAARRAPRAPQPRQLRRRLLRRLRVARRATRCASRRSSSATRSAARPG